MTQSEYTGMEFTRVPPHSIDAEQAVLGGVMLAPERLADVLDVLNEEGRDFYRRDHQMIYRAIVELASATPPKPIDSVTLGDWFAAQGKIELVGGGSYLVELSLTTPSAANVRSYAEIVAEKSRLRALIEAGIRIADRGFNPDGDTSVEIIGEETTRIGALMSSQPCDLEPVGPIMKRVVERLQERVQSDEVVHGLTTGIDEYDELTNGMQEGQLIVLAGRPGMGKTTLAQNIAEHVAIIRGEPVAVFSFEMQPEELGYRMLASTGSIDADRIRRGELDDADWARATEAIRTLRGAEIYISRPQAAKVAQLVAQIRRQHAKSRKEGKRLRLVVIDYLQLMEIRGDNQAEGYGEITRMLKLLAGELGMTILLLSQLNRDLERRPDKRPVLADLRASGSIEQDADVVVFIYRDEYYNPNSPQKGIAEIIVGKQRAGRTGTVRAVYRGHQHRFDNVPSGWIPESTEEPQVRRPRFRNRSSGRDAAAGQGSSS